MSISAPSTGGGAGSAVVKLSVRVCVTAGDVDVTTGGLGPHDGVALSEGDRVLLAAQTDPTENRIWRASAAAWQPASDMPVGDELDPGTEVHVAEGATNADLRFQVTTDAPITVGTTALTWSQTGGGAPAAHAASHTDGTDDIQDATAAQKGLATAAQITKLDGIEALADVTDETNVLAALAATVAAKDVGGGAITNVGNVDGRDVSADGTTLDTHVADTANPHATDIGNLGSGTLAELNAAVTDATLDDSSATRTPYRYVPSACAGRLRRFFRRTRCWSVFVRGFHSTS